MAYILKKCKIKVVDENYVVLVQNNQIVGYDLKNKKNVWNLHINPDDNEIQIIDKYIVYGTSDNLIIFLNIRDGLVYKTFSILDNFYLTKDYVITTNDHCKYDRIDIETKHKTNFTLDNLSIVDVCDNILLLEDNNYVYKDMILFDIDQFKIINRLTCYISDFITYVKNYLIIYDYNHIKVIHDQIEHIYKINKEYIPVDQQLASEHEIIHQITISDDGNKIAINHGYQMRILDLDSGKIKFYNSDQNFYHIEFVSNSHKLIMSTI